jgi:hypothetical protein
MRTGAAAARASGRGRIAKVSMPVFHARRCSDKMRAERNRARCAGVVRRGVAAYA